MYLTKTLIGDERARKEVAQKKIDLFCYAVLGVDLLEAKRLGDWLVREQAGGQVSSGPS